ncbi:hypothetical protein MAR_026645 [Mya arenaria]|uniref:Uncharacterized protein n=1 Tax=Mya arenaria TaxID=6604 RepID=A0ABY7ERJ3_MYAAR|nr:uncharacterized protein LOC128242829 [Mya arenaria]WAR12465.1 hypothetical protein MAR_026645 [Mya arenaria]
MDAIAKNIVGTWDHIGNDDMGPFLDAIGASEDAKEIMMNSCPRLTFEVTGDKVLATNTPNPAMAPSSIVTYQFALEKEFSIELLNLTVKMCISWEDGKMVQKIRTETDALKNHQIEYSQNEKGQLVQAYCFKSENKEDVTATVTFERAR